MSKCACRGVMVKPGTEHTRVACSVVPYAVTCALLDAMDGDRPLTAQERALVDEWVGLRGETPEEWAAVIERVAP